MVNGRTLDNIRQQGDRPGWAPISAVLKLIVKSMSYMQYELYCTEGVDIGVFCSNLQAVLLEPVEKNMARELKKTRRL